MRVRLISVNGGEVLPVFAVKVSQGRLHVRDAGYYLREYPRVKGDRVRGWLVEASRSFPSVLEHVVFTFLIEGVSRVLTHQLVRHRLASYTQESQRYSESYMDVVVRGAGEWLRRFGFDVSGWSKSAILEAFLREARDEDVIRLIENAFVLPKTDRKAKIMMARSMFRSVLTYYKLREAGVACEDARYVIPQGIKSRVLMTVNLREFLHIVRLRRSRKAQREFRELVERMVDEVRSVIPYIDELIGETGEG